MPINERFPAPIKKHLHGSRDKALALDIIPDNDPVVRTIGLVWLVCKKKGPPPFLGMSFCWVDRWFSRVFDDSTVRIPDNFVVRWLYMFVDVLSLLGGLGLG